MKILKTLKIKGHADMYCSKLPTEIITVQDIIVHKKKYIISKYCNCKVC